MLIDSHCHLHDREFFTESQAEGCLERAREAGVEKIICIGTSHEDSLAAREFASKHDNVYWTYGIHPEVAGRMAEPVLSDAWTCDEQDGTFRTRSRSRPSLRGSRSFCLGRNLRQIPQSAVPAHLTPGKQVSATRPVAIGEVGLDYHYAGYDRGAQIRLFEQMLQLAIDNDLPVSFHVREAFSDFFPVMANFPKIRGVVHSFTDSKRVLKRILSETPFYIGVNGLATYTTLPLPPLERILLETDAPFLAPVPHRGEQNEPAYVAEVAKWLAEKLDISPTEVAKVTTENTSALFGL